MLLEDLKKHAKELSEKQDALLKAQRDLEAYNKAFTAFLSAELGLPENTQLHIAELIVKVCEKVDEVKNTPPPA